MAIELPTEVIVIIAAIVGTAARTLYPYWERLRIDPDLIFERKFLGTAIVSFVGAMAIGLSLFPALLENVANSTLSAAGVFVVVALMAYSISAGSNEALKRTTTTTTTTATTDTATKPPP